LVLFGQVQKISPPQGFNPRTFQQVVSRYTDRVTSAHLFASYEKKLLILYGTNELAIMYCQPMNFYFILRSILSSDVLVPCG